MAVLLTGGAGYVGSHTAVELISAGYDVIIADNFSHSRASIIDRLYDITGVHIPCYTVNVSDESALDALFTENKIDAVIHFSGFKAEDEALARPLKYYRNNIDTAIAVLETMARHAVTKFVFSSTATIYGIHNPVPYREEMPGGGIINPYGRTNSIIEQIILDIAQADKVFSSVILRYFEPVGAHESGKIGETSSGVPGTIMPDIAKVAAGQMDHLKIFGTDFFTPDGTAMRDYVHVVDVAKAHVAALGHAIEHGGTDIFNIGIGHAVSVFDLIETFEKVNGVTVKFVVEPRRENEPAVRYLDVSKAERILGFKTERTVEDMCRDAWRWQQNCSAGEE